MVNLTRIYTRTGDAGTTRLADMSEASKTDARLEAYGAVDEANSVIALAVTQPDLDPQIAEALLAIQNELFDAGADLATPLTAHPAYPPLRIDAAAIERLEGWCDSFGEPLPALRSFILPGGTFTSALLQQARAVVRRAERAAWRAVETYGTTPAAEGEAGGVNLLAITYLNRLSDLLFILARVATQQVGEVLWIPGKDREVADPRAQRQRERILNQQAERTTGQAEQPPAN